MRKILFLLMLIPALAISQTKNVMNTFRIYPKPDKLSELQKALASHAQKYHKGDWSWRVWSIESGPESGGYMVTEGPSNWETMDKRGDISAEHIADFEKSVAPLSTERGTASYSVFQPDLSTVQLTDYADKIILNHITARPGKINAVKELIVKMKKVWEPGKESVAVYSLMASGDPGYITVTRLKEGLKELSEGYRKPMTERYNQVHGAGAFDAYLKDYADAVEKRWSELLIFQPQLSSK